jgi:hypothetical protein
VNVWAGCKQNFIILKKYFVAEHWIRFESQSDHPSAWEKENCFCLTMLRAETFICAVSTPYLRKGPPTPSDATCFCQS